MSKINPGFFGMLGWLILIVLLAYTEDYAFNTGEFVVGVYTGDLIIYIFLLTICVWIYGIFKIHKQRIEDLQLQTEEMMSRIKDLEDQIWVIGTVVGNRSSCEVTDAEKMEKQQDNRA